MLWAPKNNVKLKVRTAPATNTDHNIMPGTMPVASNSRVRRAWVTVSTLVEHFRA